VKAQQDAEAKRLRDIADQAAADAKAALDAARSENNLAALGEAETFIVEARQAQTEAKRAEAAKPLVAGIERAVGLKDNWETTLTDANAALRHYKETDPDALKAWLLARAQQDVRGGKRTIPGFSIINNPVAR
jgi:hypothetical protein